MPHTDNRILRDSAIIQEPSVPHSSRSLTRSMAAVVHATSAHHSSRLLVHYAAVIIHIPRVCNHLGGCGQVRQLPADMSLTLICGTRR